MTYKIIDLFAGPGGLGEGFAAYKMGTIFDIALSADPDGHPNSPTFGHFKIPHLN